MVIIKLKDGLGNQLFQYSIGRRIAYSNNTSLRLDMTCFEYDKLRQYKLRHFNISAELVAPQELAFFTEVGLRDLPTRLINRCKPYYRRYFIREKSFDFDANLLNAPSHVYLDGYWQSEKYFVDIKDLLRREFRVKDEPDEVNQEMLYRIQSVNAVCLHVRRGDYISDPKANQIFGICSLEYYKQAVVLLKKFVAEPHFFVFSDDPDWTQANLRLGHQTTFVTHNGGEKDYEDLRLMTACKHNIIANSSFSWWGAWLGDYSEKIVIAPKKWANDPKLNTRHRLPESWLAI